MYGEVAERGQEHLRALARAGEMGVGRVAQRLERLGQAARASGATDVPPVDDRVGRAGAARP